MGWDEVVGRVSPYLVRIETPECFGTGFLCFYNHDQSWVAIATAAHVVARADEWQQPIKVRCQGRDQVSFLRPTERVIYLNTAADAAVVLFPNLLGLHEDGIPLLPATTDLPIGTSVGWLGYPAIVGQTMCFFTGTVSAIQRVVVGGHNRSYLIDGVAINGVSGGPVIYHNTADDSIAIIGILTAYMANRQRGEALPGLSVAQDVTHFHGVLKTITDIDDAERLKKEMEVLTALTGTGAGTAIPPTPES